MRVRQQRLTAPANRTADVTFQPAAVVDRPESPKSVCGKQGVIRLLRGGGDFGVGALGAAGEGGGHVHLLWRG